MTKLNEIIDILDKYLGDTDPDISELTDEEIKEEEPIFWVHRELVKTQMIMKDFEQKIEASVQKEMKNIFPDGKIDFSKKDLLIKSLSDKIEETFTKYKCPTCQGTGDLASHFKTLTVPCIKCEGKGFYYA